MNRKMSERYKPLWAKQRGQTMALVAISMVSLLAMAALAIDIVTLYAARGQAQRSADAAALAAAKVLADSGLTTDPSNVSSPSIWTAATNAATAEATSVANQNLIVGQTPNPVTVTFPNIAGANNAFGINPQVSVQVTISNLPTFFARIWSKASNTVTATALAEAYNPSGSDRINPNGIAPNLVRCLKPLLVPNCDPGHSSGGPNCGNFQTFISTSDGTISNPGSSSNAPGPGVIGEVFTLTSACSGSPCTPAQPGSVTTSSTLAYYPLEIALPVNYCPGCASSTLTTDFENNLACCNPLLVKCGGSLSLDTADGNPGGSGNQTQSAGQCLIHETASVSSGCNAATTLDQDCLDVSSGNPPYIMRAGTKNPLKGSTSNVSMASGDAISTSDSVITLAIYDPAGNTAPNTSSVQIIGFLQVFVNDAALTNGADMQVTVLNVTGCGNSPGPYAVVGSGPAIPVRLIHN